MKHTMPASKTKTICWNPENSCIHRIYLHSYLHIFIKSYTVKEMQIMNVITPAVTKDPNDMENSMLLSNMILAITSTSKIMQTIVQIVGHRLTSFSFIMSLLL